MTNSASDFWRGAAAGVHAYENEAKVHVDIKMPPDGTPEDQNRILESLASQGYDAIALSVAAPNDQLAVLNRISQRTKIITIDSDAPRSGRLLYIGTNNMKAGRTLGEAIVRMLPDGGELAVFVGTLAADNATQRLAGLVSAIAGHGIQIVDRREDNSDRAKARSNVEDMINAHPRLDVAVGLWSYNGPAIAAAIGAAGARGRVRGAVFDEEPGTLQGIEDGTITCALVQKSFEFGYQASKWMHRLATGGQSALDAIPRDRSVETGVELITKENLAAHNVQMAELSK
ncbi:MAG: substrate-binding domain-containing protein [Pseudomonadota bacterium]